jgi:hypothetical protein
MADLVMSSGATVRAVDALLKRVGGRAVMLRLPSPGMVGDVTEQLGLAVPQFQDVELAPVAFRKARGTTAEGNAARCELLVSATAVKGLVGSLGYSAESVLCARAFGVLVDGVLMEIESATESEAGGMPYVYRLQLRTPAALMV